MKPKEKYFVRGDRVRLSEAGRNQFVADLVAHPDHADRIGTVTNNCYGETVGVRWDGRERPFRYDRRFVELAKQPKPVEEAVHGG